VYQLDIDIVLQLLRRENFIHGEKVIMVDLVSSLPLLMCQVQICWVLLCRFVSGLGVLGYHAL
jgi:hypothetical protein